MADDEASVDPSLDDADPGEGSDDDDEGVDDMVVAMLMMRARARQRASDLAISSTFHNSVARAPRSTRTHASTYTLALAHVSHSTNTTTKQLDLNFHVYQLL